MSMSDVTPGRRRLGRGLIVTAATLALPLTASISYSAAVAQETVPAPPAPTEAPVPPVTAIDPSAPEAPAAPAATDAEHRNVQTFVMHREGPDGKPVVRTFTFERHGPTPGPMPAMPQMEFHAWGDPSDPDFEKRMDEWSEQMDKWGEEYGEQWEKWSEEHQAQALAWSEQAQRNAPEVVHSCDQAEMARTTTDDGRRRVVICREMHERNAARAEARGKAQALAGLRRNRAAIANNRAMDDDVRDDVLENLDEAIERLEQNED
jgi:hypothetical protein